ncbi:uncharacterized protein LOC128373121 [Scomber japonicus]|uniref:uncharacterized protein LOC128373121 n=1 Tax=Scomber japonicus TaxID=13676 RepID=UPI002305C172|nr:uncharacterized protein LOC128373121 [Scomber japonicus]
MEKLTRCFMSVLLLSAVLSSGLTEEKFFGEGGTLEMRPNFSGEINTVKWKLNNELVAEWLKAINAVTYYGVFKGRTTLDKETGILKITKMSPADSGVYTVEINNMVLPERYYVKLIKEVPQPVLVLRPLTCSRTSDSCILVCEGKPDNAVALAEAELVTYSWKMGEGEWIDGEKIRTITNDKETQRDKTFSCRMKNPISEKQSYPIGNIFYREDPADFEQWIKLLWTVLRSLGFLSL